MILWSLFYCTKYKSWTIAYINIFAQFKNHQLIVDVTITLVDGALVAVKLDDDDTYQYHLESIEEIAGDSVSLKFMKRHKVIIDGSMLETDEYWSWPTKNTYYNNKQSILPIYPAIDISRNLTTRRHTVYVLLNHDLIRILSD